MEIYYWLLFFGIRIFISFFNWFQLIGLFIGTIIFIGNILNYNKNNKDNNDNKNTLIYSSKYIYNKTIYYWNKLTQTYIGNYILRFLVYLENNYQLIKCQIKLKIIKDVINSSNIMGNGLNIIKYGTPRISNDEEDTDED